MILTNRLFIRKEPDREAKLFVIFCEGKRKEPDYFSFFANLDSRIKLEIVAAGQHDNNSPTGLYDTAKSKLVSEDGISNLEYELSEKDEVWFVIDTDCWDEKISELRNKCAEFKNWFIAQSNPCFEVWLYYHFNASCPATSGELTSQNWKTHLNEVIVGGFDCRKHPIYIKTAIDNAKKNHQKTHDSKLGYSCSEVYLLAENFYPFVEKQIEEALKKISSKKTLSGNM
jgi:hypothetical protein